MSDLVITGASRGIGRALAVRLGQQPHLRLVLSGRSVPALDAVAAEIAASGGTAVVVPGDLSTVDGARALGDRLTALVGSGTTLVHNAGIWPARRELADGVLERAFVVNHLAPLALQRPLLQSGRLSRLTVISAGLLAKGRFDPQRTPTGADFSSWRTYCTTKLCLATEIRGVAARHPEVDVVALHPGVVRTGLGDRGGPSGALLRLAKRRWEDPATTAARLAGILDLDRWAPAVGQARWMVEEETQAWPDAVLREAASGQVREVTARLLARPAGPEPRC